MYTSQILGIVVLAGLLFVLSRQQHQQGTSGRLLLVSIPLFLVLVTLFTIIVDPYGVFGTNLFEPLRRTDRNVKINLYEDAVVVPELVILGSSRMQNVPPDIAMDVCDLPAFNASIGGAYMEDHFAVVSYIAQNVSTSDFPDYFVLGLDLWALSNAGRPGIEATGTSIFPYMGLSVVDYMRNMGTLLTRQLATRTINDSIRVLVDETIGEEREFSIYYTPDGLILPTDPIHDPRSPRYLEGIDVPPQDDLYAEAFEPDLSDVENSYLYDNFTALGTRRVQYLKDLVALIAEHDSEIVIVIPPMHEKRIEAYEQHPYYPQRHHEIQLLLNQLEAKYANLRWYDFTHVEAFGGRPNNFFDASHPQDENARRLLLYVLNDLCAKTQES